MTRDRIGTPIENVGPIPTEIRHEASGVVDVVPVSKLHVPIGMAATILVFLLGGLATVMGVWWKTSSHVDDRTVHVDPIEREKGGGIAYKSDVRAVEQKISDESRKTRQLMRKMSIVCQKRPGDGLSCHVELPVDAEE